MSQTFLTNAAQVCDICQNIRARNFFTPRIKVLAVIIVGAASSLHPLTCETLPHNGQSGDASPTMKCNIL